MNKPSRLILPLVISLISFQASSAVEPAPSTSANVDAGKPVLVNDRYTVMPGDSLAIIAAKKEVYGDARLWPLLYRANAYQIGPPHGLIFPNQVLIVSRNYTQDDVKELIGRFNRQPATPAPVVATTTTAPVAKPVPPASVTPATPQPTVTINAAPAGQAPQGSPVVGETIKLSDYLAGARKAFAAGDAPWSIYYYAIYLEQKNDDAAVWGELGNVHYFEGDFAEAAKAYYNTANLLIDKGHTAQALKLIPAIDAGDPNLSAALYQRLTTIKH